MTVYVSFAAFVAAERASFARASAAWWNDGGAREWLETAAGAFRLTQGVGAILEAARTNVVRHSSDLTVSPWYVGGGVQATVVSAPDLAGLPGTRVTADSDFGRMQQDVSVSPSTTYAISYLTRRATAPYSDVGIGGDHRLRFNFGSEAVSTSGAISSASAEELPGGVWRVSGLYTTGAAEAMVVLRVYGYATTTGEANDYAAIQIEPGGTVTSPIITAAEPAMRAADELTLNLPLGVHDLTVTFDDDSKQVFAGISGDYTIDAAALDRPAVKNMMVRAAA